RAPSSPRYFLRGCHSVERRRPKFYPAVYRSIRLIASVMSSTRSASLRLDIGQGLADALRDAFHADTLEAELRCCPTTGSATHKCPLSLIHYWESGLS